MGDKILNITVILQMSFASHRDLLFGISKHAKSHHWRLKLIAAPENFNRETLQLNAADGTDGVITYGCGHAETAAYLCASNIPLVVIGSRERGLARRRHKIAFVRNNDIDIGRLGARHLLSLGRFRSFGFVPESIPTPCSTLRLRGFLEALDGKSDHIAIYRTPGGTHDGSPSDITMLRDWISALPKPAAVMAVYDLRGTHVLDAARRASVDVPSQLAVLGVDNDELLCDFTEPTLSSISPDYVHAGELAAMTLARLIRSRRNCKIPDVRCGEKKIVSRESTVPLSPGTAIVNQAVALIRKRALDGITPRQIVSELGVSRRLAELRYRQATGESMLTTILGLRLSAVREKLRNTNLPIASITAMCGFAGENYAKNLFKARFGLSMRDFRKKARTHS